MRRASIALALTLLTAASAWAADVPANIRGFFLVSSYPSLTVAGNTGSIDVKLMNYGMTPEPMALSVTGLPQGWSASFLGNGQPITAAMPATGDNVSIQVRLNLPDNAPGGAVTLTVHADGANSRAALPLKVTAGSNLPVSLGLKADLPSLRGTPTTSFAYVMSLRNDSGRDLTVSLGAQAPQGFQATFSKQYDTQELSSIPVKAGTSENIQMKMALPNTVAGGDYEITATASAAGVNASQKVTMEIIGQPRLSMTTTEGRLSGSAEAGKETPIQLVVTNTGSAPAKAIQMSGSPPSNWKVEFDPKQIDELAPNAKATIQAKLSPGPKTIAGDYVTSFSASGPSASANIDYRVSVTTSTLWGIVGVGIVAIALLALLGAVARFGRR